MVQSTDSLVIIMNVIFFFLIYIIDYESFDEATKRHDRVNVLGGYHG